MAYLHQKADKRSHKTRAQVLTTTSHFNMLVLLLVTTCFIIPSVTGGSCWANYDPVTGKCVALVYLSVSQQSCCSSGGLSYTTREMTYEEVFRAIVSEGGVPRCRPCSSYIPGRDVCADINCGRDQHCIEKNRQPRCVCHPNCSDVTTGEPVCATNHRDYFDECHLRMVRCKRNLDTEVAYYGRCQDSCETVECPEGTCIEDEYRIPHCINCQTECMDGEGSGPVCGMNNYTYESKCLLRLTSCANNVAIGLRYQGRCTESQDCSTFLCMEGKVCAMDTIPHCSECEPRNCNHHSLLQVCGSDGRTYANICKMKQQICKSRVFVTQRHIGPCESDISNYRSRLDGETFFRQYLDFIRNEQQSQGSTPHFNHRIYEETSDETVHEEITDDNVYEETEDVAPDEAKEQMKEKDYK